VAQIIRESPWRAVVIGSASWSHGSLTTKNYYLWPDMEADRARRAELFAGQHWKWRNLDPKQIVDSGQQEFLNWVCLAGAMEGSPSSSLSRRRGYSIPTGWWSSFRCEERMGSPVLIEERS
jgi:hypothetical protein